MRDLLGEVDAFRSILSRSDSTAADVAVSAALGLARALILAGEGVIALEILDCLITRDPARAEALETVALRLDALACIGKFDDAIRIWSAWNQRFHEELPAHSRREYLRALITESYCRRGVHQIAEALAQLRRVYGELLQQPDSELLGTCALNLGVAHWSAGDNKTAKAFLEEAVVSARRNNSPSLLAKAYRNLAILARLRCRWAEAEELLSESFSLWQGIHNRNEEFFVVRSRSLIALKRGHFAAATRLADECLRTAASLGSIDATRHARLLQALLAMCRGDSLVAHAQIGEVLGSKETSPTSRPALLAHEFLGDVELEQGNAAEALKHYDEVWPRALALAPKGDIVAELRRRRAEAFLLLERRSQAYDEARAALEHCRTLGDRYEEAATYRVLAQSAAAMGKPNEARDWFDQGLVLFVEIETPYEWGKLLIALGDFLADDDPGAALDAYLRAESLLEPMGAKAKLELARSRREALEQKQPALATASSEGATQGATLAADRAPMATGLAAVPAIPRRPTRRSSDLDHRAAWALEHFGIITRYPHLLSLLEHIGRLAKSPLAILILGESGVGKELVAHGVHKLSGRKGDFVPINCGGIPRELVESEMFGHMKGAFTGALTEKLGMLELGENGTVFLDEVAEMPPEAQVRLLRFLESGELRRVGQTTSRRVNSRVVAATNRPRDQLTSGDRFRHDLFYRLGNAAVVLPPLRQRGNDLELLLDHFWAGACEGVSLPPRLTDEARARLLAYGWPGNVRQLKHVVQRLVAASAPGHTIEALEVELEGPKVAGTLAETLEEEEKQHITEALKAAHGSRTEAARLLGMARTTLLGKMGRYRLK